MRQSRSEYARKSAGDDKNPADQKSHLTRKNQMKSNLKTSNPDWIGAICLIAASSLSGGSENALAAAPVVKTVAVPMGGRAMSAKTDELGTIHLLFDTSAGPHYVNSIDDGKTFSTAIPLVDPASRKPGLEFITWDLAVTPNGQVHVALGNNAWKLKLPKEEWGFFYTRQLPGESTFAPLKNINHQPSEGFSLAANGKGTVTAVWMADKLYANVSHDDGATFDATAEIDPRLNPCNCCTTSSVYGADGRLAILYREETDNNRDMYLALWNQPQNKVIKSRVSTTPWKIDSCPMTYYSVSASGTGYVAAWPTKGDIYLARLNASGVPTNPKEVKTPGVCGMRTGLLAIPADDGQSFVVWKKDNQLGWQLYDKRGRPEGAASAVKSAGNGAAGVMTKDNHLVLFQ